MRLETSVTPLGGDDLLGLIDPLSLRRIELLQGPGSVAHGSGAEGGVINLQRLRLSPNPRLAWDARGDLKTAFDSGRLGAFGRLAAQGQLGSIALRASGGLRHFVDLQSGRGGGREDFTGGADGSADVEAVWTPRRGSQLQASYEMLRQPEQPRPDRSRWNLFQLQGRERDVARVNYVVEDLSRWVSTLQAAVRYREERGDRNRYSLIDDLIDRSHERVSALDAQVTMVSEISVHRVSYGMDLGHDWVASRQILEAISSGARALGLSPLHPDGSRALRAEAFALDQISIGSRLAVDFGARAGVANVALGALAQPAMPATDHTFPTYAASVHARYLLGDGLNLVAGVGQGFVTPNIDDLAANGCPEKSLTSELGVKVDLYGVLTGTFFYGYTQLFDAMVEAPAEGAWAACGGPPVPIQSLVNAPAYLHSVDASLQVEFSRWSFLSWLSWARGSHDVAGGSVPFDRVPPLSGYAAARYHFVWAKSFLELALRWVSPQDKLGPGDRYDPRLCENPGGACAGTLSYFYFSLRGGLDLLRWMRLHMALENLTHERYRAYASGVPAPGFSGLVGLEVKAP